MEGARWSEVLARSNKLLLPLVLSVAFLAYSLLPSLATDKVRCDQQTAPGVNCTCDLKSLRPLQGAVGMGEVRQKAEKIKAKPEKEESKLAVDNQGRTRSGWTTVRNRPS